MYKTDPVPGGILLGHELSKLMLIHYAKEYAKNQKGRTATSFITSQYAFFGFNCASKRRG